MSFEKNRLKPRTSVRVVIGTIIVVLLCASLAAPDATAQVRPEQGSGDYLEPFDTAASLNGLDFFLANGASFNNRPIQWPGDHAEGGTCGNPNTTRAIRWPEGEVVGGYSTTDPGETAYWCAPAGPGSGHFMSAFLTGGYGLLSFAPKQTFSDVRTVCYDVNATNLGNRKWHQVVIVDASIAANVAPRLDWTDNAFADSGPGSKGLPLTHDTFMFTSKQGSASVNGSGDSSNKTDKSVSDQIKRVTTCLTDRGNGNIEVVQERWDGSIDSSTLSGSFPSGDVRVVWQDVVYNANKATDQKRDSETWHWDNLYVSSNANGTVDTSPPPDPEPTPRAAPTPTPAAPAAFGSPSSGAALCSGDVVSWSGGSGNFWVAVGVAGHRNKFMSASAGPNRSITVTGVPSNAETLVTLFQREANQSSYSIVAEQSQTACNPVAAAFVSPSSGAALCSGDVVSWSGGSGNFWVAVGIPGHRNKFMSASAGPNRSIAITGVPSSSETLVTLFQREAGQPGYSIVAEQSQTACNPVVPAAFGSPRNGEGLCSGDVVSWSGGSGNFWVAVGIPGHRNKFMSASAGPNRSITVTGIPSNTETLVTLFQRQAGEPGYSIVAELSQAPCN